MHLRPTETGLKPATVRAKLLAIDLTQPHARVRVGDAWIKFKPKDLPGERLYVPSFISWNGTDRPGWRVRIKRAQTDRTPDYFSAKNTSAHTALRQAWEHLVDRLLSVSLSPITPRSPITSIGTGVTGVRLGFAKPGLPNSLMIRVSQSIETDRAHNEIFHSVARDGLERTIFNENYRRAVAARRYYEFQRQTHYRLPRPITRRTPIPMEFYPDELPVPDLFDQVLATWPDLQPSFVRLPPDPSTSKL